MKVKVNIAFRDLQAGVTRQPGDTFECDAERFAQLEAKLAEGSVSKVAAKRAAAKKEA